MKYILGGMLATFLITNIYVLGMDKPARVKRRAFRWWVASFAIFVLIFTALILEDLFLMVVVIPVLGFLVFGWLRSTKFCEWCGRPVRTNLPFTDKEFCPTCGSRIS